MVLTAQPEPTARLVWTVAQEPMVSVSQNAKAKIVDLTVVADFAGFVVVGPVAPLPECVLNPTAKLSVMESSVVPMDVADFAVSAPLVRPAMERVFVRAVTAPVLRIVLKNSAETTAVVTSAVNALPALFAM